MSFSKKYLYKQTARNILKKIWTLPLDIKIALSLFLIGMVVGVVFVSTWGGTPQFYQQYFAPAVMSACGRGYINPYGVQTPQQLSDFLTLKLDTFSCDYLPVNLLTSPLDKFQEVEQYLMGTVAFFWRLFGISWKALTPLYGIFYGATIAISYGIFRLGMKRVLAVIGSLLLTVSALHLINLPHLRDYSKAPFILAVVLIMGYMVKQPLKQSMLLGLAAACGTVLGFGFGFRMDLLICIPAFIGTVLIFLPRRTNAKNRLQIVAVFVACFFIAGLPIISTLSGGGNTFHVILLGFMSPFDKTLGVEKSPLYEWGYLYDDGFMKVMLDSYSYRIHHNHVPLQLDTREYEQAGLQYFLDILNNFPADMLTRVYAASLKILRMSFNLPFDPNKINHNYDTNIIKLLLLNSYHWYYNILTNFQPVIYLIVVTALLMFSARSLRIAIFSLLFIIYFAGYPALQFDLRHYFHLEFISLWALGFVLQQAFQLINRNSLTRHQFWTIIYQPRRWWNSSVQRSIAFALAACFFLTSPLYALRWYQYHHLGNLFKSYSTAEMEQLTLAHTSLDENKVLIQGLNFAQIDPLAQKRIKTEYLVAEFAQTQCKNLKIEATFRYESNIKFINFSREIYINLGTPDNVENTTRVFFPIYYANWSKFQGIEMARENANCITALYRVKNLSQFPLLLNLTLPQNWETLTRYQVIKHLEKSA